MNWLVGAGVMILSLFAANNSPVQDCTPQPTRVDPVYGNFTPTNWVEGSGWTWINNAVGSHLFGVWANTDFDMWFVGSIAGFYWGPPIAVHFDGYSLRASAPPAANTLVAVWGSASQDVWAVGFGGTIVHWDGSSWSSVPSGTNQNLYAVAGSSSNDVWAAGNFVLLHWDGASWSPSPGFVPDPYERVSNAALAAISPSDAIVATSQGCQRWDGSSWQTTACGVLGGREIFALSSNDVWVVGFDYGPPHDTAYRAHWDGSRWTTTVVPNKHFGSIGGTGPSDIWIDGRVHYDGSTWTEVNCGPEFTSMSVSDNGAIMGVNGLGIEYFSGDDGWPFLARTLTSLQAMGGRAPTDLWAVGTFGEVLRYDGTRWTGQEFSLPRPDTLHGAFGSSSSDIWGIGWLSLFHFDGQSWRATLPLSEGQVILAGFARTPADAIATDNTRRAWHWNGSIWDPITLPIFEGNTISNFWGTAPDDVWAVGGGAGGGAIYHWDGDSWQRIYSNERAITLVGGSGRDDVWFAFVGADEHSSEVLHWDGAAVSYVTTIGLVGAIAATSPNDVWFKVSYPSTFLHYDGVNWTPDDVNESVFGLWAAPGGVTFSFSFAGALLQHP